MAPEDKSEDQTKLDQANNGVEFMRFDHDAICYNVVIADCFIKRISLRLCGFEISASSLERFTQLGEKIRIHYRFKRSFP